MANDTKRKGIYMTNMKQNSAVLMVLLAAMLWGTTGTAQALAPPGATPLAVGTVRLTFGGLILLCLTLIRGSFRELGKNWPWATTLIASLCIAFFQPFFFAGVARTGVAVGTIVAISSSPVFAGILGYFVRKEKPAGRWFVATGLAIFGNFLLLLSGSTIYINILGILLSLVAGFAYASYSVASKKLLETYPVELVVGVVVSLGGIIISPLLFFNDLNWLASPRGLAVSMHLGLFTIAVAYSLYNRGLTKIAVANAVTLTLAEPLVAAILGIFLLGEEINLLSGLGISMLFLGMLVLSVSLQLNSKKYMLKV